MSSRFDVVVVGGGTAGCVLAGRLSEDARRSVCLVEAGPDYGHHDEGRWPHDLLDGRALAFSHSWETDRDDRSQLRARVLGGCSSHNACIVLEGAPADYDEWGQGWTYGEIAPYLERARAQLGTRTFQTDELSPWQRAFAAASEDAIVNPVNARGTTRWNAAFAYVDPARRRPNLTILADALADRVLFAGTRATGIATTRGEVRAATIVLACGAYGSPGVLLRSGIGPETGLPVGENLLDHVGVGFGYEPTAELVADAARFLEERPLYFGQVTVPMGSTLCTNAAHDLFVFPAAELDADGRYDISAAVYAMKPRSRGSVRLTSSDPHAPLAIDHGFLGEEQDAVVLSEGVDALRSLIDREPLSRYATRETRPGAEVSSLDHVRASARGFFHPTGTCAIGHVVDTSGRVLGYDGLVVADASIMPTIPRANTNLTTAAVAERIAELLAGG